MAAAVAVALVALTVWTFASLRWAGFAPLDDAIYVSTNPHVLAGLTWSGVRWAWTTGTAANWHPITWLSYMAVVSAFGTAPGPQHVLNVLLHVVNVGLLFGLLRRVTGATGRSAIVAGLFAVHPLHVESVAWIAERKDVLSTGLWLATLWVYADYVRVPTGRRYAVVAALFAIGLMSKPMLVTLPFTLLLLDAWPLRRVAWRRPASTGDLTPAGWAAWWPLVREKIPLFLMAAVSSVVTFVVQRTAGAVKPLDAMPIGLRLENAVVTYVVYLGHTVWPRHLIFFYPHPAAIPAAVVIASAALLVALSIGAWWLARRWPYVLMGWLWYVGTLVPVIGLVQVGAQAMADRYTYVPLVGVFVAVVWGLADLTASRRWLRRVAAVASVAVIAGLAAVARVQAADWESGDRLWTRALSVVVGVDEGRAARAVEALADGRGGERPDIARFFELPRAPARAFMGTTLERAHDVAGAEQSFREALAIDPTFADAHDALGQLLGRQGRIDEAIAEFTAAERLAPDAVAPHRDLGFADAAKGRTAEAIAEDTAALALDPGMADVQNNLGSVLGQSGRLSDAIPHFREAIRIDPDLADAHRNLALAYAETGDLPAAVREFREVLRIRPDDPVARRALAQIGGGRDR